MKKLIPFFILSLCCAAVNGNAQDSTLKEGGRLVKEIAIPPFEIVITEGGGDFFFHYAPDPKVALKGKGSCIENTAVEVSSNTLRLRPKGGISGNCRMEIHIYAPYMKEIQQEGGGNILIKEGFAPVDRFKCSIAGGGTMRMTALKVDSLLASIDGGGEISARVNKLIHGKISGGGVIFYQGDPVVESDISGGGAIKRK